MDTSWTRHGHVMDMSVVLRRENQDQIGVAPLLLPLLSVVSSLESVERGRWRSK